MVDRGIELSVPSMRHHFSVVDARNEASNHYYLINYNDHVDPHHQMMSYKGQQYVPGFDPYQNRLQSDPYVFGNRGQ